MEIFGWIYVLALINIYFQFQSPGEIARKLTRALFAETATTTMTRKH